MQLPWLVNLVSLAYDVDCWLSGRVLTQHSMVAGSISIRGDHGIHCWWDLIRLKQLSSVSVCHAQVFARFSGHGNLIHNIISLPKKKKKCTSIIYIHHIHLSYSSEDVNSVINLHGSCFQEPQSLWLLFCLVFLITWQSSNWPVNICFNNVKIANLLRISNWTFYFI